MPRASRERKDRVKWWVAQIRQPKHVVLTIRNTAKFTREVIKHFKESWARLLRNKFVRNWRGGFYTLEVTNEGKGWHLHLHALIDADWIDAGELAKVWNFCNRGTGYIVKVKDAREQNYLAEVTKYAVKGSDLAAWSASDIADFIDAWGKLDTFGVFGSIRGQQAEWRKVLDEQAESRKRCVCGCNNFEVHSDQSLEWAIEVRSQQGPRPPPIILPPPQREFERIVAEAFSLMRH